MDPYRQQQQSNDGGPIMVAAPVDPPPMYGEGQAYGQNQVYGDTYTQPVSSQPSLQVSSIAPMAAPAIAVPVAPGNGVGRAIAPQGGEPVMYFSSGICDWYEQIAPSCLMATCCPCFQYARVAVAENVFPGNYYYFLCCAYACYQAMSMAAWNSTFEIFLWFAGVIGKTWSIASMRMKYRAQRLLQGSVVEDVCCALCCTCCTLSQMARHTFQYQSGFECDVGDEFTPPAAGAGGAMRGADNA